MTQGGYQEVWKVAGPLLLSQASFVIMQFCDRIMLARYGSVSIEAAVPGGMLAFTLICFFQAAAAYAGTFSAQYAGAGDTPNCVRSALQGIWIALLGWLPILALIPAGFGVINLCNHPEAVAAQEKIYFCILMLGGFLSPLNGAFGGYFTAVFRTKINFIANTFGCALNILFNWMMIYGHCGFSEGGIAGAAWATLASQASMLVYFGIMFFLDSKVRSVIKAQPFTEWAGLRTKMIGRILKFGTPSGVKLLLDVGVFTAFAMIIGRFGNVAMAANNIAFSINNLAFAPLLGFGLAASAVVARYQGARQPEIAMKAGNNCLKLGFAYMTLIGLSFVFLYRQYFEAFLPDDPAVKLSELLAVGRPMLLLMAAWGLFDTVNIVMEQALAGAGDTRFVMTYVLATNWLFFIPGTITIIALGHGILAVWGWMAVYIVVAAAGLWIHWIGGKWKKIKLV